MVRAFARKSERQGKRPSGQDETGWLGGSASNEVSPASVWGLDDERSIRNAEEAATGSENEWQSRPVNEEDLLPEFPDPEPSPSYNSEPDWWSQPNLVEDLPTNSPTTEQVEAPSPAMSAIEFEELHSKVEQQPDEDTLTTEPVAEAKDTSTATSAAEVEESFSELEEPIPDEDTLITQPVTEATSTQFTKEANAEVEWTNQTEQPSVEFVPFTEEAIKAPAAELDEFAPIQNQASAEHIRLVQDVKRPRLLDETSVLPSEASYATVRLNQEIKPRSRVLDESTVLPHEASFATVPLYQATTRSYSPGKEFVNKVTLGLQRSLPVILLAAVCGAVIVFSVKYKSKLFDSADEKQVARPASVSPPVKSSLRTEIPTTTAKPVTVSSTQEAVQPEKVHEPPATTTAPPSQKPATVATVNPVKQTATDKSERRQEPDRTAVSKRKAQPEKTESDTATKTPVTRSDAAAATVEDTPKSGEESKSASGGGERPRRVKPKEDSQANGTSPPKPKVIDWP
jgi:hypothetical protein